MGGGGVVGTVIRGDLREARRSAALSFRVSRVVVEAEEAEGRLTLLDLSSCWFGVS